MADPCQRYDCCGDESYTYDVTRATPNPSPILLYNLQLSVAAGEGIVSGAGDWAANTFVTISATPAEGYVFDKWIYDIDSNLSTTQVFMDDFKIVAARFEQKAVYLNLLSNPDGSATLTGQGEYFYGDIATIEAFPLGYFEFQNWSGDIASINNPEYVLMDEDKAIVANLYRPERTLLVSSSPENGGSVSGGGVYLSGQVASLSAIENSGFKFSGWSGDEIGTDNPLSVLMDVDKSVTANFNAVLQCGTLAVSGIQGTDIREVYLSEDIGLVSLSYNAYTIPDQFIVTWNGNTVIDTGSISGDGVVYFTKTSAQPDTATVTVVAPLDGTAWDYTLGCPQS